MVPDQVAAGVERSVVGIQQSNPAGQAGFVLVDPALIIETSEGRRAGSGPDPHEHVPLARRSAKDEIAVGRYIQILISRDEIRGIGVRVRKCQVATAIAECVFLVGKILRVDAGPARADVSGERDISQITRAVGIQLELVTDGVVRAAVTAGVDGAPEVESGDGVRTFESRVGRRGRSQRRGDEQIVDTRFRGAAHKDPLRGNRSINGVPAVDRDVDESVAGSGDGIRTGSS